MARKKQLPKDQIISALVESRQAILKAAAALPADKQGQVFLGIWSVKDLLAHLAGWDHANMAAVSEILDGQLPSFYSAYDRDWRSYNASLVSRYRREDFAEMLRLVESTHRELIESLQMLPAEKFNCDRGIRFRGFHVTIARLLQAEARDEQVHLVQLKGLSKG